VNLLPDLRRMLGRPEIEPDSDEAAAAYVAAGPEGQQELTRSLRRPIIGGSIVVGLLFVGLLLWTFLSISGAVLAPGVVRVENNSKEIRRLEGGVVRQILVREGQLVRKGQTLIRFDDTQSRSVVAV